MSVSLAIVLAQARTYLNDDNSIQFPDTVIIPKIQQAHQELTLQLRNIGSPTVRNLSSILTIPANASATTLTFTSSPALPADLLTPTQVFESANSAMAAAVPVTEVFYLPIPLVQAATIGRWVWQEENLILNPCSTSNEYIQIMYIRQIPIPVIATDLIGVLNGEFFLAARAAAMVAATIGGTADAVTALNATAQAKLQDLLNNNRGSQKPLMKP